ncbi:MAG: hypothetical protein JXL80_13455 [Planctomycetes bacterium]|nr:hypothetical protein [Planctomycetota bacterium]
MAPEEPRHQSQRLEAEVQRARRQGRLSQEAAEALAAQVRRIGDALSGADQAAADDSDDPAGLWRRFLSRADLSAAVRREAEALFPAVAVASVPPVSAEEAVTLAEKSELAIEIEDIHDPSPADLARESRRSRNLAMGLLFSVLALVSVGILLVHLETRGYFWPVLLAVPTIILLIWAQALKERFPRTAMGLLVGTMALVPLNLLAVGFWTGGREDVGVLITWAAAGLLALVVMFTAARAAHVPWALPTAAAATILASAKLTLRDEYLRFVPTFRPYVEFILLGILALGVAGMLIGLYRRRREGRVSMWVGVSLGALLLLWPFALVCLRLFTDLADRLEDQWIGTWLVGLGILFMLTGVAFLRIGGANVPPPTRRLAVALLAMAGVAAVTGLLLSADHVLGTMVGLSAIFVVAALLGAYGKGKEIVPLQAVACSALPLWAAVWCLRTAGFQLPQGPGGGLIGFLPDSATAATGFALSNALVFLFGLLLVKRDRPWTDSVPLVSGLSLGILGWLWLASVQGAGVLALPRAGAAVSVPPMVLLMGLPALLMATAWRVRWQPSVYLAALGLLAGIGTYVFRTSSGMVLNSAVAAGLSLLGALLALGRKRNRWAAFYSEGLLVMSLAATVLMGMLVAVGAWESGIGPEIIVLVAAMAMTLLVAALVFRQEDLFGFFGLSLVLLALVWFHVYVGPQPGRYLCRYATAALAAGIVLSVAAMLSARQFRKHSGMERFAGALYVPALAAAAFALGFIIFEHNAFYRAADLVVVATIVAMVRPHVRHATTNYAVAAAITAAVYIVVTKVWGGSAVEIRQAVLVATGLLAMVWMLVALAVRWLIFASGVVSDKDARMRSRPFTVVGMAMASALAVWLTLMTVLAYGYAWGGRGRLATWLHVEQFDPAAAMIAWVGVFLAFLLSLWLFRRTWRTFLFYLVGSLATVNAGLLFDLDGRQLVNYLICAIPGYGAIHMLVYFRERQFMAMLERHCALYKDEVHASTTIFTAGCISCFIGGIVAAFHLHTTAALVTMSIMTAVFFVWSFGRRRAEFLYPAVLFSVGTLLSIWHHAEGYGPWTADRININAVVFAVGGLVWLGVGAWLNRLRGPMSVLSAPACQMSAILSLTGLGFFMVLAVFPAWATPDWLPDDAPWRFILGSACGAALAAYFLWAALRFRRTFFVYFLELALVTLLILWTIRTPSIWQWPALRRYWPLLAANLSLAVLALATVLESRRHVLFSRPVFFTATAFLPAFPFVGAIVLLEQGYVQQPAATFGVLTATCLLGSLVRGRALLLTLAAIGVNALLACLWFQLDVDRSLFPRLILIPAGATLVLLGFLARRAGRTRLWRLSLLVGLMTAFAGCFFELAAPSSGLPSTATAAVTAAGLGLAAMALALQFHIRWLALMAVACLTACLAAQVLALYVAGAAHGRQENAAAIATAAVAIGSLLVALYLGRRRRR